MSTMRESAIQKAIARTIRIEFGGAVVKVDSAIYGGFPDLTCILPGGVVVFIEVKQPGKYPSKLQYRKLAELRAMGHRAFVARSLADVRRELTDVPTVKEAE